MSLDTILAIVFGISTLGVSIIAIKLQVKAYKMEVEDITEFLGFFRIYTTRDALVKGLKKMYDSAEKNDLIWGQCIGCSNYFKGLHEIILRKSTLGVSYKVIVNSNSSDKEEMIKLFGSITTAETKTSSEVRIRLHGLSQKQVIVSFKSLNGMVAIHFYDSSFVEIIKSNFVRFWESL